MRLEPPLAARQQLLDLLVADVIVLLRVEHRRQHDEVSEQVCEPARRRKPQRDVGAWPPVGPMRIERDGIAGHSIAEWLEEPLDKGLTTAARRKRGNGGLERDGAVGQRLALAAAPGDRFAERAAHGDGEERGRSVGPIVDVLREQSLAAALSTHQRHRIDVEHERRRASVVAGLRIEEPRAPERQLHVVEPCRVLVQQVAEVRCRAVRGRDLEIHADNGKLLERYSASHELVGP